MINLGKYCFTGHPEAAYSWLGINPTYLDSGFAVFVEVLDGINTSRMYRYLRESVT